jgi:hypothetical protein
MPGQPDISYPYCRKPVLITLQKFAIHHRAANLEQEVRSPFTPAHMLALAQPPAN